jgi:hypothetical protein
MPAERQERHRLLGRAFQLPPLEPGALEAGQVIAIGDRVTMQRMLRAMIITARDAMDCELVSRGPDHAILLERLAPDPQLDRPYPAIVVYAYFVTAEPVHRATLAMLVGPYRAAEEDR